VTEPGHRAERDHRQADRSTRDREPSAAPATSAQGDDHLDVEGALAGFLPECCPQGS
jgi:hypothetical protein